MRKIFIDAGANKGSAIAGFRRRYRDEFDEYEIYAFEPLPLFKRNYANVKCYQLALWTYDGTIDFIKETGKKYPKSSTVMKSKLSGKLDRKNPIKVKCIDFSKWIIDNFALTDYIRLGMDIEGAEYMVLPKMIKDGSIDYINDAKIEFHYNKMDMRKVVHDLLLKQLRGIKGLNLYAYNASREKL